uniref:Uncharacterized protein LOC104248335 n=1 Tax=Nicotiana sylvestris TaxID=4096 RepID=A0A1U7YUJ4_NICSY|nr:PREDICTED: uncharacterized protein LOC104248335 [Nicotiana sylvestris]
MERIPDRGQETGRGDGILPIPEVRQIKPQGANVPTPKWKLPGFEGQDPKVWIRKCERFGDVAMDDVVEEFNKLSQLGSVDEFLSRFEDLKAQMIIRNPALNEDHFLSSFVGALKEEIRFSVKLFKPRTLSFAIQQARMQEKAIEAAQKKQKQLYKSSANSGSSGVTRNVTTTNFKPTAFRLSPEVYEYMKNNYLCFRCGEKYGPRHQCKTKQLQCIVGESEPVSSELASEHEIVIEVSGIIKNRKLSVLVDSGSTHSFIDEQTVKETGYHPVYSTPIRVTVADVNYIKLSVLVDSGSAHSFIDEQTVKETGYHPVYSTPIRVTVADGNYMYCSSTCPEFTWKMTGKTFKEDLRIIKLGVCDIVLGNDWMKKFNPTTFDHEQQTVTIGKKGNRVVLQTIPEKGILSMISGSTMGKILRKGQKEELEKQVKDMMSHGIIEPSQSPFSSPALLVKKRDGTWRFCVDYMHLNEITIKDKYPIPIVDDLLDELQGSGIFPKIDQRAEYHQIRMRPADVHKTTFRTHQGHYEFRVMPFGLTNAPATFQALMNQVFQAHLRKFVLVFFDDILVYSKSLNEHLSHLVIVFEILKDHSLFAKRSKCYFGQPMIEYFGHVITAAGVSTDPEKIQAMIEWPKTSSVRALRGFLGLTGYYRKYVQNYGIICRPLTELLRKDAFKWTEEVGTSFETLKVTMTNTPVLALPDYSQEFIGDTIRDRGCIDVEG